MTLAELRTSMERRIEAQGKWLHEHAPECFEEQRHTDEGTQERIYWHYGYRAALIDILAQLPGTKANTGPTQ